MKIIHVVPCADEASGVFRVARLLAEKQSKVGHSAAVLSLRDFNASTFDFQPSTRTDEVWTHGMWLPAEWRAMRKVVKANGPKLVRMTHGSLSPVYLEHQSKWKKRLAGWLWERRYFRLCDRVVVTCAAEAGWCRAWGVKGEIEVVDLRECFRIGCATPVRESADRTDSLHVLYLGRRHPLKGVRFLEQAVLEINGAIKGDASPLELRVVCDHFGEELERDWAWCDVLCLPTLSENFGLVVAEALERGKRVITTDGAPVWAPSAAEEEEVERRGGGGQRRGRLLYLRGFRDGTDEVRVKLLKDALGKVFEALHS